MRTMVACLLSTDFCYGNGTGSSSFRLSHCGPGIAAAIVANFPIQPDSYIPKTE